METHAGYKLTSFLTSVKTLSNICLERKPNAARGKSAEGDLVHGGLR